MIIKEIHQQLVQKKISAVELTKDCLKKIDSENKDINALLISTPEFAIEQAKKSQEIINQGKNTHLLCGIPCVIKDNILVKDVKCTAASKILENYIAPFNASVVKKLKKCGAVILGKTNMDEFAMGSSTENSAYGPTKNPIDKTRVPGGSSGGSTASIAADFCQFALGSDTGGSIRQPSSFCGVVGLKPTYGAVSRYGLIAMASSFDQIGPIGKSVEDVETVFDAIRGKDLFDSTSIEFLNQKPKTKSQKLKIGIPKEYFISGIEKGVLKEVNNAIGKVRESGIEVKEISLPHTKYALAVYYLIMSSEVSANLARFDGIKYGASAVNDKDNIAENLFEVYSKTRGEKFGREVKRRIILGTFALSVGYYDQFYLKAQKVRELIKKDFDDAFQQVDLILTPASPTTAFKIGEKTADPIKMYLADILTVSSNLTGLPALSLPCGKVGRLPVGLQIIGRLFEEKTIFSLAKILEKKFKSQIM